MQLFCLSETPPERVALICHSAMRYSPRILKNGIENRRFSSFLYILRGEYRYTFGEGEGFTAGAGDLLYLPQNASYSYAVLSAETLCLQCEITLLLDGQPAAFSRHPLAAPRGNGADAAETLGEIAAEQAASPAPYQLTACLFRLLACFAGKLPAPSSRLEKIRPALEHIRRHAGEKISLAELAGLCYLSPSQLRRIFQAEFHLSPVQWKNQLLMQRARALLKAPYNSIGEVSDALGFETVYAFSRLFKKETGLSPSQYARQVR